MKQFKLLLRNAAQIVCIGKNHQKFKIYPDTEEVDILFILNDQLNIISNGSLVIGQDGKIYDLGKAEEITQKYTDNSRQQLNCYYLQDFDKIIECSGKCILPGFIDAHTHSCYSGDRSHEFVMKLQGATYMDIHKIGGGIYFTVKKVNEATEEELITILLSVVQRAQKLGTTLMEVKSGYGLNKDAEIKQLRAINKVNQLSKVELVANYCGGHSLQPGMNEEQSLYDILNVQLPAIIEEKQKGNINPEFIDVFCEKNIFEVNSTREILLAGVKYGLIPNYHGEQLNPLGSTVMGVSCGAIAISHLEHLDDVGIKAMAEKNVVGVILPTTHYILKLNDPPVRKMLEAGVPVAIASDFCPNAHCMSLPLAMSLACLNLKMKVSEALCGVTLNAAAALNRSELYGSLEIGKWGDLVIINECKWEHIIYQIGDSPIYQVIKKGEVI